MLSEKGEIGEKCTYAFHKVLVMRGFEVSNCGRLNLR